MSGPSSTSSARQLGFFMPTSDWRVPATLPCVTGPVAVDLETYDPYLRTHGPGYCYRQGGFVVGIAVAAANFKTYVPLRHEPGENYAREGEALSWFRDVMSNSALPKIFANASYDVGWSETLGIEVRGPLHDVQVQSALLDEYRRSNSLESLSRDFLQDHKDTSLLKEAGWALGYKDPMGFMHKIPSRFVGPYAEHDAELTYRLWEFFNPRIEQEGLGRVYDLEMRVVPVLVAMRRRGIRVDIERAEQLKKKLMVEEKDLVSEVRRQTGFAVDIWSPESVGEVLAGRGLKLPRTRTNRPSATQEILEAQDDDVARLVVRARLLNKAWSTFIDGTVLSHWVDGRVHAQFHAMRGDEGGTVGGRFTSTDPNLQQLPARRAEFSKLIKGLFLPEEGDDWWSLDYASQEPRLTVHFAALCRVTGADRAVAAYQENPRLDYHQMVADLCRIERKLAKTINLGLAYGMGEAKLCRSLGLPTERVTDERTGREFEVAGPAGKAILEAYLRGVPFIPGIQRIAKQRANSVGYVRTLYQRRCRFPLARDGKRWYTHKALNRLIQGSAADQTKEAMCQLHAAGFPLMVTVHDEVGLSLSSEARARAAVEVMAGAVPLVVPVVVDLARGPSWGELEDLEDA